jgi:N-glycosylase/DNA lyase
LALLLTASIVSYSVRAPAETWWHNIPSYFNAGIARTINAEAEQSSPIMMSDSAGYDGTSIGDLISISYRLKDNVRLYLTKQTPNLDPIAKEDNVLVFRPSGAVRAAIAQRGWQLTVLDDTDGQLWRLKQ